MGHLCHTTSSQGSSNIVEEEGQRLQDPEVGDERDDTVSYGYYRDAALRSTVQYGLPVQDHLSKIKFVNIPARARRSSGGPNSS